MILPTKHIRISDSLFGLGGYLLNLLNEPMTVDTLWRKYSKKNNKKFPAYHSFDNVVLALNLLFMIGIINVNDKGELYQCD
ncbi:MAG: ABC-three component system middle component 6 [Candidatus Woesearchaeota archaeon]